MRRAVNTLRAAPHYRREAFDSGLRAAGFALVSGLSDPRPGDALLIWNRYGAGHALAQRFEAAGATVLVAENCPLGNSWRPGTWYSLARTDPATVGGAFPVGSSDRWESWGVAMAPWRKLVDGERIVLGQRSIGHEAIASPPQWAERVARRVGGRARPHPGTDTTATPLEDDLRDAVAVYTWASSAALRALLLGVPVWSEHPRFVGAAACAAMGSTEPNTNEDARRAVFRALAWCMWELTEVQNGQAIRRLCGG